MFMFHFFNHLTISQIYLVTFAEVQIVDKLDPHQPQ